MTVCEDCWRYKEFGKKCYYHWNDKKICSAYMDYDDDEPHTKDIRGIW